MRDNKLLPAAYFILIFPHNVITSIEISFKIAPESPRSDGLLLLITALVLAFKIAIDYLTMTYVEPYGALVVLSLRLWVCIVFYTSLFFRWDPPTHIHGLLDPSVKYIRD